MNNSTTTIKPQPAKAPIPGEFSESGRNHTGTEENGFMGDVYGFFDSSKFITQENIKINYPEESVEKPKEETSNIVEYKVDEKVEVNEAPLTFGEKSEIVFFNGIYEKQVIEPKEVLNSKPQEITEIKQEVAEEIREERAEVKKSSENQEKLVDFKLLYNFSKDTAFPQSKKFIVNSYKETRTFLDAQFSLAKEYIFFKVPSQKEKEEKAKQQEKQAKNKIKMANISEFTKWLLNFKKLTPQQKAEGERINTMLGYQSGYELIYDNSGNIRQDVQKALEEKQNKMAADEEKNKKSNAISQPSAKAKPGEGLASMHKATENQSHWSKQIG